MLYDLPRRTSDALFCRPLRSGRKQYRAIWGYSGLAATPKRGMSESHRRKTREISRKRESRPDPLSTT